MNRIKVKFLCGMLVFAMAIPLVGYTGVIENVKAQNESEYDAEGYDTEGYDRNGYDRNGYDRDGYDRDGYDEDGYDRDGYDRDGYDNNGYDRNGYDAEGYDENERNKYGVSKYTEISQIMFKNQRTQTLEGGYVLNWTSKNKITISSIIDTDGNKIKPSEYKYTVKKKKINKNGYGDYEVTIKLGKKYNNYEKKVDVQIIPWIDIDVMASRTDSKYCYNEIYFIGESAYKKKIDGIEYRIGELKEEKVKKNNKVISRYTEGKFKKIYKKGTIKLSKNKLKTFNNKRWKARGFHLATLEKAKLSSVYECDARPYVIIGGKKRYTKNWSRVTSVLAGKDCEWVSDLPLPY